jgi:hypothetical protein
LTDYIRSEAESLTVLCLKLCSGLRDGFRICRSLDEKYWYYLRVRHNLSKQPYEGKSRAFNETSGVDPIEIKIKSLSNERIRLYMMMQPQRCFRLDGRGVGVRVAVEARFLPLHVVHPGSVVHSASYSVGGGGGWGGGVSLGVKRPGP